MANPKSKTRRKVLVFSAIAVVLIGLTLLAIFRPKQAWVTVQTEKVTRRSLTELVVANGRIQPVLQVVINPEVSGEIVELPVKEGQEVKKGDLLLRIKPENYLASRNSAEASHKSALANQDLARANREKAELEYKRVEKLYLEKLVSDSAFLEAKTTLNVMKATYQTSVHQAEQAKATLAKAEDDLAKTIIFSPMPGTVTRLKSQRGERVVGTALMAGTEVMTIADLNEMEARVDIGEVDVILIALGQHTRLEVDAFRDREFTGVVTEIANAAKGPSGMPSGSSSSSSPQQQEATKFEVKIRVKEKEALRPGMSVTAEIETRSRTNVLTIPIQSVTTRLPKDPKNGGQAKGARKLKDKNGPTPAPATNGNSAKSDKRSGAAPKPIEVVFLLEGDRAKQVPVKRGISDDTHVEITEGLSENQEVVSGGFKAINRDLEDGKKAKHGTPEPESDKEKKK